MFRAFARSPLFLVFACGCGLVLDTDPGDDTPDSGASVDSSAGAGDSAGRDAALDAVLADAPGVDAPRVDAGPTGAPPCGGPSALFDDFEDGVKSAYWLTEPGTTVESSGELYLDPSESDDVPQAALYASTFDYDARDDRVAVWVKAVIPVAGVQTLLALYHDDTRSAAVVHDSGELVAWLDGAVDSEPYDPIAHAWWQIRSDGTNVHFEVSPDGVSWRRLGSGATAPTPSWFEAVSILIGTRVSAGVTSSGVARMDQLNLDPARPPGGSLHAVYCDAHTFMDDFGDDAIDPNRWYPAECPISEGMGSVKLGATTDARAPCGLITRHAYALGASQAVFERATAPAPESWVVAVVDAAGVSASAACMAGDFAVTSSDGARFTVSGCPEDPYWRLEVRSGRIIASTSDGTAWSGDAPLPMSSIDTTALRIGVLSSAGHAGGTEVASYNAPGL